MKYELFDRVALLEDAGGVKAGAVGTIMEMYPATDGLEVEFFDEHGETIVVLTLDGRNVRKVSSGARSKPAR